jgi:hypothetical protein
MIETVVFRGTYAKSGFLLCKALESVILNARMISQRGLNRILKAGSGGVCIKTPDGVDSTKLLGGSDTAGLRHAAGAPAEG